MCYMNLPPRILLLALLLLSPQFGIGFSDVNSLARLRAKIAVEPVAQTASVQLAGQYTSTPKELGPQLSGEYLYLFPDQTYIYCEWADIQPLTIYDKGTWGYGKGFLELKSGPEITWNPELERKYLLVRRASRSKEVLLVGTERDLPYFEHNAGDDAELMLLIVSMMRTKQIRQKESAWLKRKLMRDAWRPQLFSSTQ
jgi:hypothetical protein